MTTANRAADRIPVPARISIAALIATAALLTPAPAEAIPYYLRSVVGAPWNRNTNELAMDAVFGVGNWRDARYESVNSATLFSEADFIFMEGGDDNASEMESFLIANAAAIDAFVNDGGVIFFNSAPNEGDGMSFGFGVQLIYPAFCRTTCRAVDPAQPIFNGPFLPVGTDFTGTAFTHARVEGSFTAILQDVSNGGVLLAEKQVGRGHALFGGMTTTNFHSPQPQATNLRQNIIAYASQLAVDTCFTVDAIDDAFEVINDGSASSFPVLQNDECVSDEPISVVALPGDLQPDRGGVATTDGETVSYVPAAGFAGFEEFTYTAEDAGAEGGADPPVVDRDTASVVVNVLENLLPDAVDDEVDTPQTDPIEIDVLANDSLGNPPNVLQIESAPGSGTASLQPDETILYTPDPNAIGEDVFSYRLTDANGDSDVASVSVGAFFVRGEVAIDVLPADAGNNVNLRVGQGSAIEVAILSVGEYFDAPSLVDPLTLKLGAREGNIWGDPRVRDVDADGDDDLVVRFLIQQLGIGCGDTHVTLSGRTFDFEPVTGTDRINTFNCPRIRKRH